MLEALSEINEQDWQPVSTAKLVAVYIAVAVMALLIKKSDGWVMLLDNANLVFHEAGHPFFGLFSNRLMVYGGTLGQLVFPIVATVTFWQRREAVSCALALIWVCENFLNIARYMADATVQVLPLVGGGEHDWTEIFNRWHVLQSDVAIASFVRVGAWLSIAMICMWLSWRWRQDTQNE